MASAGRIGGKLFFLTTKAPKTQNPTKRDFFDWDLIKILHFKVKHPTGWF